MDTTLKQNKGRVWEIRWSERTADGWRSRAVSTRSTDRTVAEKVRREFVRGEEKRAVEVGDATLGRILDGYAADLKRRDTSRASFDCLKPLREHFADLTLDDITPDEVDNYSDGRGVSGSTLRRELSTLEAALRWGAKHGLISRVPYVVKPAPADPRPHWLDETREQALWMAAAADRNTEGRHSRIGRFICIGLETAARKATVLALTWDRVDFKSGVIDFRVPGKRITRKRQAVTPITPRLRPILERAQIEQVSELVCDHQTHIHTAWNTWVRQRGFEGLTPHVLRHTRITLLLRAGVSIWDVSKIVGASAQVIDKVYGHSRVDSRLADLANIRRVA